ncbi:hypothetical protein K445DRAFT_42905, partial [Daldinia sp. EC12]
QPRAGQVEAIKRIVFRHGDVILVAWTGYGKTLVFQTVSLIMKEYVTIQICPLTRLGQNQHDALIGVPGLRPLLIADETQKSMWCEVAQGKYTHVILGPEQATQDRFYTLFRDSAFNQRLAMVAIDELHMVHQWKEFRTSYPNLYQIRGMIPNAVPWFGCTATLSKQAQDFVLDKAGFREEGRHTGQLAFIRATVDRPNIAYIVSPLDKGYIIAARHYLLAQAIELGMSRDEAVKAIRRYDADTRPDDKQRLYDDFAGEQSPCRIMFATVALGMGMDIRDVRRVVQFGAIASGDLADLIQRFGRAARDGKTAAKAYFFVPYWYFKSLG